MIPSTGYRGAMARALRDPRLSTDRPGQRPLLQGHLRKGGHAPAPAAGAGSTSAAEPEVAPAAEANVAPAPDTERSSQPAEAPESGAGEAAAIRGKSTTTPADVATRPHLEGSEQGPS